MILTYRYSILQYCIIEGTLRHLHFSCDAKRCNEAMQTLEDPLSNLFRNITHLGASASRDAMMWERGLVANPMDALTLPVPLAEIRWEFGGDTEAATHLEGGCCCCCIGHAP